MRFVAVPGHNRFGFCTECDACFVEMRACHPEQFMRKGKANILGCISVINNSYGNADKDGERLVPRTEELPLYTTEEFNDKVKC